MTNKVTKCAGLIATIFLLNLAPRVEAFENNQDLKKTFHQEASEVIKSITAAQTLNRKVLDGIAEITVKNPIYTKEKKYIFLTNTPAKEKTRLQTAIKRLIDLVLLAKKDITDKGYYFRDTQYATKGFCNDKNMENITDDNIFSIECTSLYAQYCRNLSDVYVPRLTDFGMMALSLPAELQKMMTSGKADLSPEFIKAFGSDPTTSNTNALDSFLEKLTIIAMGDSMSNSSGKSVKEELNFTDQRIQKFCVEQAIQQ